MITYTNGYFLQSFPVPDGPEWRIATEEDIEAIETHLKLARQALIESEWRETEMPAAQQNITALAYGELGIPGTVGEWQQYWLALRKWTADNPDFPDTTKRPVSPI